MRSDASELQAIVMDLQHLVSQMNDGSISTEQIERYLHYSEEADRRRFTSGLEQLKHSIANLSSKISTEIGRDVISERHSTQGQSCYDYAFPL
ncbi:hypothetical protein OSTOST_09418 [Ostertagia ostertagi]